MFEVWGLNTFGIWTGHGANFEKDEEIPTHPNEPTQTIGATKNDWQVPERVYQRLRHHNDEEPLV